MVLGYDCHKINFKKRLCVLDCPNHCPIYGRAVVWAVIGDCPTGVPIGGALSAAQTTPLFVTDSVTNTGVVRAVSFPRAVVETPV